MLSLRLTGDLKPGGLNNVRNDESIELLEIDQMLFLHYEMNVSFLEGGGGVKMKCYGLRKFFLVVKLTKGNCSLG